MQLTSGLSILPQSATDIVSQRVTRPVSDFRSMINETNANVQTATLEGDVTMSAALGGEQTANVGRQNRAGVVETHQELYEQRAFSVHKLSYIDEKSFARVEKSADDNKLPSVSDAPVDSEGGSFNCEFGKPNAATPFIAAIMGGLAKRSTCPTVLDKDLTGLSMLYVRQSCPIDRTRISLSREQDQALLLIRDHFSSEHDVLNAVRKLITDLNVGSVKVLINGKEV